MARDSLVTRLCNSDCGCCPEVHFDAREGPGRQVWITDDFGNTAYFSVVRLRYLIGLALCGHSDRVMPEAPQPHGSAVHLSGTDFQGTVYMSLEQFTSLADTALKGVYAGIFAADSAAVPA